VYAPQYMFKKGENSSILAATQKPSRVLTISKQVYLYSGILYSNKNIQITDTQIYSIDESSKSNLKQKEIRCKRTVMKNSII
jgi:hypothetical protein